MTIAHDAASEGTGTTSLSCSHVPAGTPRGVVVVVAQNTGSAVNCTAVSYGSASMTKIDEAFDTTGEPGGVQVWFLGSSIPTGNQTVTATVSGAQAKWICCITVTAGADTELAGNSPQKTSGDVLDPSVTVSTIAGASYAFGALFSGLNNPANIVAGSGFTKRHDHDFGNQSCAAESSTSEQASGNQVVGFSTGGSDDVALIGIAIQEVSSGQSVAITTATETDTGIAMGVKPGINPSTETDAAQALGTKLGINAALESDAAQALGIKLGIQPALETDTAIVITPSVGGGQTIEVITALETDEARALGIRLGIVPSTETDVAQAIGTRLGLAVALETDVAQAIGKSLGIEAALEADTALVIVPSTGVAEPLVVVILPALEVDEAMPIQGFRVVDPELKVKRYAEMQPKGGLNRKRPPYLAGRRSA